MLARLSEDFEAKLAPHIPDVAKPLWDYLPKEYRAPVTGLACAIIVAIFYRLAGGPALTFGYLPGDFHGAFFHFPLFSCILLSVFLNLLNDFLRLQQRRGNQE